MITVVIMVSVSSQWTIIRQWTIVYIKISLYMFIYVIYIVPTHLCEGGTICSKGFFLFSVQSIQGDRYIYRREM